MGKRALLILAEGNSFNFYCFYLSMLSSRFYYCPLSKLKYLGAEEMEVVITIDTLRRGGVD